MLKTFFRTLIDNSEYDFTLINYNRIYQRRYNHVSNSSHKFKKCGFNRFRKRFAYGS